MSVQGKLHDTEFNLSFCVFRKVKSDGGNTGKQKRCIIGTHGNDRTKRVTVPVRVLGRVSGSGGPVQTSSVNRFHNRI